MRKVWLLLGIVFAAFVCWQILRGFSRALLVNHEGTGVGNLGEIRSALAIYYGNMNGQYPSNLDALTTTLVPGNNPGRVHYLATIPTSKPSWHHQDSSKVQIMTNDEYIARKFSDEGGWTYVVGGSTRQFDGTVVVNCTHLRETRGEAWTNY